MAVSFADQDPPAEEPAARPAESGPAAASPADGNDAKAGERQGRTGSGASDRGQERDGDVEERMVVVGDDERDVATGSVAVIDAQQLARQESDDIHRILAYAPGVNFQEEDGFGLRPNIGFRGSGVERSGNITLLEDGILVAPAPYAAPSAYYFPTAGRLERVEIRKGSSSIRQGPYTHGGTLNLVSTSIPNDFAANVTAFGGTAETFRGHANLGGEAGPFGWLVETYQTGSDGFKDLPNGDSTGFELQDYLGKFRWQTGPDAAMFQRVELKVGRTLQDGDETYLGLTVDDFDAHAFRRYAASSEDGIDSDHDQYQLRYFLQPGRGFDMTATLYRNEFFRNWRKLERAGGTSIASILAEPEAFASELSWLRGETDSPDDALDIRNNRRDYVSEGLDLRFMIQPEGDAAGRHAIEVGVRYHEDEEDRFQEEDRFAMVGGELQQTTVGDPGSQSNRIESAEALSTFVQDTIRFGRFVVTPGVRFESIEISRENFGTSDPDRTGVDLATRSNSVDVVIPGVGFNVELQDGHRLFAGVHRGFAPPGSSPDVDEEESVNYEVGYRFGNDLLRAEGVAFFNDDSNLLGSDSIATGGTGSGDRFNAGEVEVYGLEASLSVDAAGHKRNLSVPVRLAYTFTRGEFQNSFDSDFDPWGDVVAGDELPYLAEHQLSLGVGIVRGRWSAFADASFVDEMRTAPGQGEIRRGEGTDARTIVDLSLRRTFPGGLGLFAQVKNATDETYVAATRPAGLRPGIDRQVLVGVTYAY